MPAEEKKLSQFISDVAQAGYGKTQRQVMNIAESIASDNGVLKPGHRISFESFMKRQPELTLRKGDATANVQMPSILNYTE